MDSRRLDEKATQPKLVPAVAAKYPREREKLRAWRSASHVERAADAILTLA
jgi:hypothetical protein